MILIQKSIYTYIKTISKDLFTEESDNFRNCSKMQ